MFIGLGWPWVGEFVGFIIICTCFPTQHNLVYRKHPIAGLFRGMSCGIPVPHGLPCSTVCVTHTRLGRFSMVDISPLLLWLEQLEQLEQCGVPTKVGVGMISPRELSEDRIVRYWHPLGYGAVHLGKPPRGGGVFTNHRIRYCAWFIPLDILLLRSIYSLSDIDIIYGYNLSCTVYKQVSWGMVGSHEVLRLLGRRAVSIWRVAFYSFFYCKNYPVVVLPNSLQQHLWPVHGLSRRLPSVKRPCELRWNLRNERNRLSALT